MQVSDEGIAFLAAHEGIVPAPYKDSVNVLTYGIGHTAAAGSPNPADLPQGMPDDLDEELREVFRVFRSDLERYAAAVERAVKRPMTQAQFDAAVSFHFNTGAIGRASWVKKFNAGDTAGAAKSIMGWTKPKEIIPRRKAEQKLFRDGDYGKTSATVWGVSGTRVVWRPVRVLSQAQIVEYVRGPRKPPQRPSQPPKAPTPPATKASPLAALLRALAALLGGGRA